MAKDCGTDRPTDERDPVLFAAGLVFERRWDATKLRTIIEELCAQIEVSRTREPSPRALDACCRGSSTTGTTVPSTPESPSRDPANEPIAPPDTSGSLR